MRKWIISAIIGCSVCLGIIWLTRPSEGVEIVRVYDTIYKDTLVVEKRELMFADAKWLRRQLAVPNKAYWKNYSVNQENRPRDSRRERRLVLFDDFVSHTLFKKCFLY